MWRSLAAHLLWEQGVGSWNLPIPTINLLVRRTEPPPIYPQPGCRATIAPLAFRLSGSGLVARRRSFGAVRRERSGRWVATYLDPVTRLRVRAPATFGAKADASAWL